MKKLLTILIMLFFAAISAQAGFEPVRIIVVNPEVESGNLTVEVLNPGGGNLNPAVTANLGIKQLTTEEFYLLFWVLQQRLKVVELGLQSATHTKKTT